MKAVQPPSAFCYAKPVDTPAEALGYCVVQVKSRTYAVAEYAGRTCHADAALRQFAQFVLVTGGMTYTRAVEEAARLTAARHNPEE